MRPRWMLALLLGFTFLVFVGTLRNEFIYDDTPTIVQNPRIQSWSAVPSYFTTHVWAQDPLAPPRYYRPLFLVLLRAVHAVFGIWSPGWHFVLLLCHLAAVASVFWMIRQWQDDNTALIAAALFALHPIHAEVVSWATEIGEACLLVALVASLVFARREGRANLALSLLTLAAALLLKETAAVWPFVLFVVLYDGVSTTVRRVWPHFALTAIYLGVRMAALGSVLDTSANSSSPDPGLIPAAIGQYVLHLVFPVGLSEFYFLQSNWSYLALVIPVLAFLGWVATKGEYQRTAVLILTVPLLPVLNLRSMQAEYLLQDRYLYLPSVGFVMLLALLIKRVPKPALAALLAVMALGCIRESRTWSDNEHLYKRALELNSSSQFARDGLARAYARQGRYNEAIALLEPLVQEAQPSARRLKQSLMTLAYSHEQLGHLHEAYRYYFEANNLYPQPEIEKHLVELQAAIAAGR